MPAKRYRVELTSEEREELKALVSRGRSAAYKQTLTLQTIFIRLSVNPLFHRISCRFSTAAQIHHR